MRPPRGRYNIQPAISFRARPLMLLAWLTERYLGGCSPGELAHAFMSISIWARWDFSGKPSRCASGGINAACWSMARANAERRSLRGMVLSRGRSAMTLLHQLEEAGAIGHKYLHVRNEGSVRLKLRKSESFIYDWMRIRLGPFHRAQCVPLPSLRGCIRSPPNSLRNISACSSSANMNT